MEYSVTLTEDDLETIGRALECYYRANRGSSSITTLLSSIDVNHYARCERDRIEDLAAKLNIPKKYFNAKTI